MHANFFEEYESQLGLPVATRNASANGPIIDCSKNAKSRRVWVTIISGGVTDGKHQIKVQSGTLANGSDMADTTTVSDPIDNTMPGAGAAGILTQSFLFILDDADAPSDPDDLKKPPVKPFIRLVHNVVTAGATGATLGAIVQFPSKKNLVIDVEEPLRQCAFALGAGAQMNIQSDALEALCQKTRRGFETALKAKDGTGTGSDPRGGPRWKAVSSFLLSCTEEIGRKAAAEAKSKSAVAIRQAHLKKAYKEVSDANKNAAAGDYCPNWGA